MRVAPAKTFTEIETSAAIAGTFTPSFESGVATAGCGGDGGKPGPAPQPDLSVPASPLPEGNRGQNSRAPAITRTIAASPLRLPRASCADPVKIETLALVVRRVEPEHALEDRGGLVHLAQAPEAEAVAAHAAEEGPVVDPAP